MTISQLKTSQIIQWRNERSLEAKYFSESSELIDHVEKITNFAGTDEIQYKLKQILSSFKINHQYENIFISSKSGKIIFTIEEDLKKLDDVSFYIKEISIDKKTIFSDYYFCEIHNTIHYDIISPVLNDKNEYIASLIFRMNPQINLEPLILSWPVLNRTSETFIYKKEKDYLLFLNKSSMLKDTLLSNRIPLIENNLMVIKSGFIQKGILECSDYRNKKILAYITPIKDTRWFMLSKLDQIEVFSELYYRAFIIIIFIIILMFLLGTGLTSIYNFSQKSVLRENKEYLDAVIKASNTGFWVWDLNTDKVVYSSEWKKQIGYEDIEIKDEFNEWKSRVHPDDLDRALSTINAYIKKPWPDYELDFRFKHKDGSYRWILTKASIVFDKKGIPVKILGSHLDITNYKHTENMLKSRDELLKQTGELAKVGGWEFDTETLEGTWTDEVARIHDLDPDDPTNVKLGLSFYTGESRKKIEDAINNAMEKGWPYDLELEMTSAKGIVKWVRIKGYPIKDINNKIVKIRGIFQDISEQKQAKEKILKLTRIYQTLSNINQTIVRIHNRDLLFKEVCDIAINDGKFLMSWIGLTNEQTKNVDVIAYAGTDNTYFDKLYITVRDEPGGKYPAGTAIREGRHVIINNIETEENMSQWKNIAKKMNFCSSGAFPIKLFGKTIGSLNLYSSEINFFDSQEINLLDELSYDLSFAVEFIETEKQRKIAEEELRKSEQLLNNILEQSPYAIWISDEKGTLIMINKTCKEMLDITDEDVVGKYNIFNDRLVKEQGFIPLVKKVFEKGETVNFELKYNKAYFNDKILKSYKNTLYLDVTISPIRNSEGLITNIVIQHTDISGRKKAEMALNESEEIFNQFMNYSPIYVFFKDRQIRSLRLSKNFEKMLGRPIDELIGKTMNDLFPSELAKNMIADDKRVLKNGKLFEVEEEFNGRFFHTIKFPIAIGGKSSYLAGFTIDITERKKAEEEILKGLKEKETLLRELYHRTKNNMQVIIAMLELQAGSATDPDIKKILKEIINRIQSLVLVHQKLYQFKDLSRIDLKGYIDDLVSLLKQSFMVLSDKINIILDLKPVTVFIETAIPCGLILNELISNAIKYAFPQDRKGTIEIKLYQTENDMINIDVSDNGVGVKPDFDFFKQKSLGLKIIVNIINYQLQGNIKFDVKNGIKCHISFINKQYSKID